MSIRMAWRKSSRSNTANDNCVEVSVARDDEVLIRDSKDRPGPVLAVGRESWGTFLNGVRAGRLDLRR